MMRANPLMQKALTPEDVQRWREHCELVEALDTLQRMDFDKLGESLMAIGNAAIAAAMAMCDALFKSFDEASQGDYALAGEKE
jgi:hypothetical protein